MSVLDDIDRIRAARPNVVVIGDFLLDGWWTGRVERLAREAPAPVVEISDRTAAPGGAANTAVNLAALGARVSAVGAVGDDASGAEVRAALERLGVDVTRLRTVSGARTTTKIRIAADDQLLVRLDEGHDGSWSDAARSRLRADVREASASCDAQVICDYDGGLLDDALVAELSEGPRPTLRVVDAHDARRWRRTAPDVVTPNSGETERLLERSLGEGERRVDAAARATDDILAATGARAAAVTLDRAGTVLLRASEPPVRTHAHPTPEKQASGAGDVFVAGLVAALASGVAMRDAVALAQQAADVAVRRPGTCVCTADDLASWAGRATDAALPAEELLTALERHRDEGARIVFTNGCFDVLHRGHTSYLRQARRLGDVLVVAVNGDESVRRLKGPDRPVNEAADRANVLAELECVDYVTVFDEDSPSELIRRLRPHVYAKGGDYTPEMLPETSAVRESDGEIVILDYVSDHSTTEIIGRIRASDRGDDVPAGQGAR